MNTPYEYTVKKTFYNETSLQSEEHYKDGKKTGEWTERYRNGKLRSQVNYKNDKKNGMYRIYYDNGRIFKERNYKDDKKHGVCRRWYDNGQLGYEANYTDGKLDGVLYKSHPEDTYDDIGVIQSEEIHFKDGKKDGLHKMWDTDGKMIYEVNYKDGEPVAIQQDK